MSTLLERPKLRLIPSPKTLEADVIVEKVDDSVFEISLLREHGTTVAAVFYTREQLELLIKRAKAALEF